jgi:hypothetical protein
MIFAAANAQMVNPELLRSNPEWVYFAERADSILDAFSVPASIPPTSGPPALQDIVREPQPIAGPSVPQDFVREPRPARGSPHSWTPPLPPAFLLRASQPLDVDRDDEMDIDSMLKSQLPPRDVTPTADEPEFPPITVAGPLHSPAGSSQLSPSSGARSELHDQLASSRAAMGSSATTIEPQNPYEGEPPPVGECPEHELILPQLLTSRNSSGLDRLEP